MTPAKDTCVSAPPTNTTAANTTGLWITTHEPIEATRDLTSLCRAKGWRLDVWDCDRGLAFPLERAGIGTFGFGLSRGSLGLRRAASLPSPVTYCPIAYWSSR